MFFFKRKELHVDCFTSKQYVHDLYPIDYSHKFFPDWWKALPKSYDKQGSLAPIPTMKSCVGFNAYFKHGMTIPLWSDMYVGLNGDNTFSWQFSDGVSGAMSHDFKQMDGGIDITKYVHVKLHTPWLISCKEDVEWAWTGNTWGFYDPSQVVIPPAVISYKYNKNADVNMFLNFQVAPGNKIFLKQGTPLVNVIPLTERKLKIHLHKVSNEEYFNIRETLIPTSFLNKYGIQKRIMEKQEEEKKCPFRFGK